MTELANLPDSQLAGDDDEISLLDLLIVLVKHKKLVLGLPFVVAVITAGYSLTLPNIYTASTKLLPPRQSQSVSSSMLAQLGGLASLVGGGGGLSGPNDLYISILKSRAIADDLIQRFGLMKVWEIDTKYPSDAYKRLAGITNIISGKDGLISIDVDDKDPKFAAELANAYVDALLKFTSVLAVTEASQRRLFLERQLALAKENLAKVETSARQALQTEGVAKVDDEGRSMLETTARLRGQISVKEVQISAMRTFATDRNPELQRAQQELESMKHEMAKIEGVGGIRVGADSTSGRGMNSLPLLREVKYQEVVLELLAKQYEMAKIDEAKESAVIQVMDKAVEPDRKSKPARARMVVLYAMVAAFFAILWAFLSDAIAKRSGDPRQSEKVQAIKRYLGWRRQA